MGLVYVFMVAWIAGGVLLGSNLLLEHASESRVPEGLSHPPANDETPDVQRARSPVLHVVALTLIGFGLGGLLVEGLDLMRAPWSCLAAVVGAAVLGAFGWFSRGR